MLKELLSKLRKKALPAYRSGWQVGRSGRGGFIEINDYVTSADKKEDVRTAKKPVDVFKETLSDEPIVNLNNIDGQIKIVERRIKLLTEELGMKVEDEYEALAFLRARKNYLKCKGEFNWATTTFALIEKLLSSYKLKMVDLSDYYKTVPTEAIDELEKFIAVYKKVCGKNLKPVLKLIIEDTPTSRERTKRTDPILLAGSPFGKWFYVLGAWDKEVEVVDDLIYHGK